MALGSEAFGRSEVIKVEPHDEISVLLKETSENSLPSSTTWGHSEKHCEPVFITSGYEPERALTTTQPHNCAGIIAAMMLDHQKCEK